MQGFSGTERRKKIRLRSWARLKLVLLCVGLTGSVLGAGMVLGIPFPTNVTQRKFGLVYVLCALVTLLFRQAVVIADQRRKRKGSQK